MSKRWRKDEKKSLRKKLVRSLRGTEKMTGTEIRNLGASVIGKTTNKKIGEKVMEEGTEFLREGSGSRKWEKEVTETIGEMIGETIGGIIGGTTGGMIGRMIGEAIGGMTGETTGGMIATREILVEEAEETKTGGISETTTADSTMYVFRLNSLNFFQRKRNDDDENLPPLYSIQEGTVASFKDFGIFIKLNNFRKQGNFLNS